MRIAMFVYNSFTADARVTKEATTLAEAGHDVTVFAVQDADTPAHEERDGYRVVRIWRDPVHYRLLRAGRSLRRAARLTGRRALRVPRRALRLAFRLVMGRPPNPVEVRPEAAITSRSLPVWLRMLGAPFVIPARGFTWLRRQPKRGLLFLHKPLMFANWYRQSHALARTLRPDACHAHDLITLPAGAWTARSSGATLVYDAHELYPEVSTLSQRERRIWAFLEQRLIGRAQRVVTVCDSIADELVTRYRVAPRPLVVLNCPERPEAIELNGTGLRERAGVPSDRRLVLYQGGFAPYRGLPALVRAMHDVPDATLVMMGWGRLEPELRTLVAHESLDDRVVFIPPAPRRELTTIAAAADVGVIPYESEGLNNYYSTPNKLFEYIAAGLPIAASRFPELVRFVEGLEVGVTFAPVSPDTIAAALCSLLDDPAGRAAMSERARAASAQLVWEVEGDKLVAEYARLAGQRSAVLGTAERPRKLESSSP